MKENKIKITIGGKTYKVIECKTEEEREKGLQNVQKLADDEGALFYHNPSENVSYWMEDTYIPLDLVFINEDQEVISVKQGEPLSLKPIEEKDVAYVLEVNQKSGIKKGDFLNFEDEETQGVMKVLAPDGSVQMWLQGGERIVSRRETKILIKKAKRADKSKDDKDYKALGKYIFKVLKGQDERPPEYVENKTKDSKEDTKE